MWATFDTTFTIQEDEAIGTSIVTLSATDDDEGIHGVVIYETGTITTSTLDTVIVN